MALATLVGPTVSATSVFSPLSWTSPSALQAADYAVALLHHEFHGAQLSITSSNIGSWWWTCAPFAAIPTASLTTAFLRHPDVFDLIVVDLVLLVSEHGNLENE